MSSHRDPLWASAQRLRDAQRRVEDMRALAFKLRHDRVLHERAIAVLFLLDDSLFELTIAHDMLGRLAHD